MFGYNAGGGSYLPRQGSFVIQAANTFFGLTGLHGAHVTGGIIWLISLWGLSMQGRIGPGQSEAVEIAGLYWHFVDVVWIVIFTVIYLIPK